MSMHIWWDIILQNYITFNKNDRTFYNRFRHLFVGTINEICFYRSFPTNTIVRDEGNDVGDGHHNVNVGQCKTQCNKASECNSFAMGIRYGGECYLKDKIINGNEATEFKTGWTTYYRICG